MGNEQSSTAGGPAATAAPKKADYYELLGVDRQASDDEIKKAYRKKALELHPDRNFGDVENATRKFAEVQTAYDILADAQERAWYDSHRDAILRGDDPNDDGATPEYYNMRMTTSEELFTLIGKFNSSVPFTDARNGFFGILKEMFDSLTQQEIAACEWDGQPIVEYPSFGSAIDDYDSVAKPFYSAWSNFATRKNFGWKDKWRLSDAPDRRVRRLMEKENKKLREDAVREFNDAVRSLVSFVRKRDPRYVPNKQSEEERQKILRDSAAAQAARSRAANQEQIKDFAVPEWAQSRTDETGLEGEFSESEEESEVEVLECVVCNKIFKTEKQYQAHEQSKKHAKAVHQLKRQMKKENINFDIEEPSAVSSASPAVPIEDEEDVDEEREDGLPKEQDRSSPTETEPTGFTSSKVPSVSSEDEIEDNDDDDYAPRAAVAERLTSGKKNPLLGDDAEDLAHQTDNLSLGDTAPAKKVGKAKAKKEKKAAKQAAAALELETDKLPHKCVTCEAGFDSKTKLFNHLKQPGHAAPVATSGKAATKTSKAGKKKR